MRRLGNRLFVFSSSLLLYLLITVQRKVGGGSFFVQVFKAVFLIKKPEIDITLLNRFNYFPI